MRDLLTVFAIVLIVVLTAALAAPYFIDWNGQRAFVEERLSNALGQKVTIGGTIDVKLLPTPYLVLGQTVIGGDDAPVSIGIHHLDLELSIAPLLHGEFDVVEAKLEEPTIRVTLQRDRSLPALPDAPAFQADVRFDRISVADGTLAIADPESGHTFVVEDLDFDADAPSLAGPYKGSGAYGKAARTKFRFGTGAAQGGKARTRLIVDETLDHPALDLDGLLTLAGAGQDSVRQSFDGTVIVSGHVDQPAGLPIAWKLSGPLKADPQKATLDGGELRLGGEDGGLTLAADAVADLGATPHVDLDLKGKQLDIDRLAGAPVDAVAPPPPKLPPLATLQTMLAAASPPLPTTLDLAVDTATWGADTLSDIKAHVGLGGDAAQSLKLAGDGPGGLHIGVDGMLTSGTTPAFDGTVAFGADNLPRAIEWLGTIAPSVTVKPADVPFRAVKLDAKLAANATAIDATKLALTLDRSVLGGSAYVTPGDGPRPAKVVADLSARALDLDELPDMTALSGEASPFDLDLRLDAKALQVSRVGDGALDAGHIDLALTKRGRHVALKRFRAENLGGATIEANGDFDGAGATLAMTVDARRLDSAAALVRQLAPGDLATALVERASALAPAKLAIDATLAAKANDTLVPSRVTVTGLLAATKIDASLVPDKDQPGSVSVDATLDAPEGSALLRQLGVATLPLDVLGHSSVILSAHGPADQPLDTDLHASFGATRIGVAGRVMLLGAPREGSGTLSLKSRDLSPLLQSLALAFPDMTGHIPAEVDGRVAFDKAGLSLSDLKGRLAETGLAGALHWAPAEGDRPALTGSLAFDRLTMASLFGLALGPPLPPAAGRTFSSLAFASGLVSPPRSAIALRVKQLDLAPDVTATDAAFDLGVAPNLVAMHHLTAGLDGGRIVSDVTLRRDGPQGALEARLSLDKVHVDLPDLHAALSGKLDLAGSGPSASALVSSLAGSGEASLADATIQGADPAALPRVFQEVEADEIAVDEDAIVRALQDADHRPLDAGTRHFTLGLAAGVLRFDADAAPAPGAQPKADVTSRIDGTLDLKGPTLDTHVEQTLDALPKNWAGPPPSIVVSLTGPPRAQKRSIDASGLVNAVATRALARESARIEAYEFDIRERALFNQRLQSEHRRDQDRQKAEDDTRKAEAERKARAEAARLEKIRRDEAAARDKADRETRNQPPPEARPAEPSPPASPPADTRRFESPQPGSTADPSAAGRY